MVVRRRLAPRRGSGQVEVVARGDLDHERGRQPARLRRRSDLAQVALSTRRGVDVERPQSGPHHRKSLQISPFLHHDIVDLGKLSPERDRKAKRA